MAAAASAAAAGRAVQACASSSGRRAGGASHNTPRLAHGSAPVPAKQQQARRGAATVAAAKTPRRRGGADVASVWSALVSGGHTQAAGSGAGGGGGGHEDTTPVVAAAAPGEGNVDSSLPTAPSRKRGPEAATATTRFFEDDPTEHVEPCVDAAQAADTRALNRDGLLRALSALETKEREVSGRMLPTATESHCAWTLTDVHISVRARARGKADLFLRAAPASCPQVHEQSQELFGLLRTVTRLTQIGDELGPAAAALSHTASIVPPPPSSVPMPRTTETTLSHPEVEEVGVPFAVIARAPGAHRYLSIERQGERVLNRSSFPGCAMAYVCMYVGQEACTVQHPGALCCTKWKLDKSPGAGAVTVKMETTCEQQGNVITHDLEMEDYVALALRVRPLSLCPRCPSA